VPVASAVELQPFEVAFLLQRHPLLAKDGFVTESAVRAAMRRGERRQLDGASEEEILDQGSGLPVTYDGAGRRRVPARALRALLAEDELALEFLEAISAGRLRCPRAAAPTDSVPRFSAYSHRL
jgi:hypothetical protein